MTDAELAELRELAEKATPEAMAWLARCSSVHARYIERLLNDLKEMADASE